MEIAIIYSSRTGNTRRVAEAIFHGIEGDKALFDVKNAPDPQEFQWIIVGFWVNRGLPEDEMYHYMQQICNKTVSLFMTLGAYPDSKHAQKVMAKTWELLAMRNRVKGNFICQGKIDPELTERLYRLPKDHPHYMDEARIKRHKDAAEHPNEADLIRAQQVFSKIQQEMQDKG